MMGILIVLLFVIGIVPFNYRPDFIYVLAGRSVPIHQLLYFGFGLLFLIFSLIEVLLKKRLPLFIGLNLIFFSMLIISASLSSFDKREAIQSSLGTLLRGMAPGFLVYWIVFHDKKENLLIASVVLFGLVVSAIPIYEVLTGDYFIFSRLVNIFPPWNKIAAGAIGQPLPLAVLIGVMFPFALDGAVQKKTVFYFLSVFMMVTAVLLTYRRTGYFLVVFSSLSYLALMKPGRKMILAMLGSALLCGLFVAQVSPVRKIFVERFSTFGNWQDLKRTHRVQSYVISWNMARERPLFGIGTRQYGNKIPAKVEPVVGTEWSIGTPDSQYLRFLAENGIPGLLFFLGYAGWMLVTLYKGKAGPHGTALFLSVLVLMMGLVFIDGLYWPPIQYLAGIIMGLGLGVMDRRKLQSDFLRG